jgi:hypothetical protein
MTFRCAKDNITAFAAIAPVRAAAWHKFFSPETHTTAASMPGFDINFCLINKFHVKFFLGEKAYTIFKSKIAL